MEIETYEIVEQDDGPNPALEVEAIALIRELALTGQISLIEAPDATAVATRVPYPEMTAQEVIVYQTLFPARTKVAEYSAGIIPIRVLQVVSYAVTMFDELAVWHKPIRAPDPILVGTRDKKLYLLARWGSALKPFRELLAEAREAMADKFRLEILQCQTECEFALGHIAGLVEKKLAGGWVYISGPTL